MEFKLIPTLEYLALPLIEKLRSEYSDAYKDLHGVRPRHTANWSEDDFVSALESVYDDLAHEMAMADDAEFGPMGFPQAGEGWGFTPDPEGE